MKKTTSRFSGIVLLLLACALWAKVQAAVASPSPPPPAADGLVALEHASTEEVARFLRALDGEAYEEARLGDWRLADLDGSGERELVVSVDNSSRAFFNELHVLRLHGRRLERQVISVWNVESLAGALEDLDGDGRIELIVPQALTPYQGGAGPLATWRAVYALQGGRYAQRSARYSSFYRERELPRIDAEIELARSEGHAAAGGGTNRFRLETLLIERDKVLRILGDRRAGLASALVAAKSSDPQERVLAAGALADIDDPAADRALASLEEDSAAEVAIAAHAVRAAKREHPRP